MIENVLLDLLLDLCPCEHILGDSLVACAVDSKATQFQTRCRAKTCTSNQNRPDVHLSVVL